MPKTEVHSKTKSPIKMDRQSKWKQLWTQIVLHRSFYLLMLPGILYFILFRYAPMWGLVIAFQDYNPFDGIWGSPWVGFAHFIDLFTYDYFYTLLRNTLVINFMNLVLYFPIYLLLWR